MEISCAVLEDGTRVISELAINNILGSSGGKSYRLRDSLNSKDGPLPLFLSSKPLKPFIDEAFNDSDLNPVIYNDKAKLQTGYPATILPKVCEVWLKAKDAKVLQKQQLPIFQVAFHEAQSDRR